MTSTRFALARPDVPSEPATAPSSPPRSYRDAGAGPGERGSATVELVLLTPLLITVLLLMVLLGRLVSARLQVDTAASQAARAASLTRDPAAATHTAALTAADTLTAGHHTCAHLTVTTDTSHFTSTGWVAVTVTCSVNLTDLSGLRLPGTETVSSRFVEPLDRYRTTT